DKRRRRAGLRKPAHPACDNDEPRAFAAVPEGNAMTVGHAFKWAATALLIAGCASMGAAGSRATAALAPTAGNSTAGTVTFTRNGDRVRVVAEISGLAAGAHGFHIYEKGDWRGREPDHGGGRINNADK